MKERREGRKGRRRRNRRRRKRRQEREREKGGGRGKKEREREGEGEKRVQKIGWDRGERQPKILHIIFKLCVMDQLLHNLGCDNRPD